MELANIYRLGSRGEAVRQIQKILRLYPDGIFGPVTEEAVRAFQKANGLTADGIVGAKTLTKIGLALLMPQSRRVIKMIVVHCADTPEGRNDTIDDIRRWHKQQGWADVGYHYVITLDGTIQPGRNEDTIGAHCQGFNTNSIGVCYIGGRTKDMKQAKDTRTVEQKAALRTLLMMLKSKYPSALIVGHRDLDKKKSCPSFDVPSEFADL